VPSSVEFLDEFLAVWSSISSPHRRGFSFLGLSHGAEWVFCGAISVNSLAWRIASILVQDASRFWLSTRPICWDGDVCSIARASGTDRYPSAQTSALHSRRSSTVTILE